MTACDLTICNQLVINLVLKMDIKLKDCQSEELQGACIFDLHTQEIGSFLANAEASLVFAASPPFSRKAKKDVPVFPWQDLPLPSDNSTMHTSFHSVAPCV